MGAGASTQTTVGETTGVTQGVENRRLISRAATEGYQAALLQVQLLKDCASHDFDIAATCLKTINECANDKVTSKESRAFREELCGLQFDGIVVELMSASEGGKHDALQQECFVAVGSLAYQSEARKERLIRLGASDCICSALLRRDVENVKLLEEGLWACGNLCAAGDMNKGRLFSHQNRQLPSAILACMSANQTNPTIAKCGLIALGNFANDSKQRSDELVRAVRPCIAEIIPEVMRRHGSHADVACYGCYAVANICEGSVARCSAFGDHGLLECLCSVLKLHDGNRLVAQYACKLTCIMMRHGPRLELDVGNSIPRIAATIDVAEVMSNARQAHSSQMVQKWAALAEQEVAYLESGPEQQHQRRRTKQQHNGIHAELGEFAKRREARRLRRSGKFGFVFD